MEDGTVTTHLMRDLEDLKKEILAMGAMVEEAVNKAITALVNRTPQLAQEVMVSDNDIDMKELDVEDKCLKILALHQPVAADLRFIVAVMKVNNDLERMGDTSIHIAERAAYLAERPPIDVPLHFDTMVDRVRTMVRKVLDALVERNPDEAREVIRMDDEVDELHWQMFDILMNLMDKDPSAARRAFHTLSASRHLERIGDYATNIAEDVVFMVEGEIIRHRFKTQKDKREFPYQD